MATRPSAPPIAGGNSSPLRNPAQPAANAKEDAILATAAKAGYITRMYHDRMDVQIICDAIGAKQNTLLLGPAGTGKSALAKVVANQLGRKFVYVPCHTGATQEALLGQWIPNPKGTGYVWMDGIITAAVRHGHIVLLDEVNSLKPEVSFCIHGLLDWRRELVLTDKPDENGEPEVVGAHENFGLIAAGNPTYEGVRVMNEAFRDRFAVQLSMNYNAPVDEAVLKDSPIVAMLSPEDQVGMQLLMQGLRSAAKAKTLAVDVSTRALLDLAMNIRLHTLHTACSMFANRYSDDDAAKTVIRTIIQNVWDLTKGSGRMIGGSAAMVEEARRRTAGRAGQRFAAGNAAAHQAESIFQNQA